MEDIGHTINKMKWRWTGHIAQMEQKKLDKGNQRMEIMGTEA